MYLFVYVRICTYTLYKYVYSVYVRILCIVRMCPPNGFSYKNTNVYVLYRQHTGNIQTTYERTYKQHTNNIRTIRTQPYRIFTTVCVCIMFVYVCIIHVYFV